MCAIRKIQLLIVAFFLVSVCSAEDTSHSTEHDTHHSQANWGYRNENKNILPRDWYKMHPKCYGLHQSPINVNFASTTFDVKLEPIEITKSLQINVSTDAKDLWTIKNNGHSGI